MDTIIFFVVARLFIAVSRARWCFVDFLGFRVDVLDFERFVREFERWYVWLWRLDFIEVFVFVAWDVPFWVY